MKKSELLEVINQAIGQMRRVGEELNWSEPIDEGYVHTLDELRDAFRKSQPAKHGFWDCTNCRTREIGPSVHACPSCGTIKNMPKSA